MANNKAMSMSLSLSLSLSLALVLVSVLVAHLASAQPSGCTAAIVGLAPCLGYITGNSSTPTIACCTQLGSVVQSQPQCLCSLLNGGGSQFGLNINQTLALALPQACNVQTPPLSRCNAAAPAPSPAAALPTTPVTPSAPSTPGGSAPTTPATPSNPTTPSGSGKGSNTVPTGESSDESSYKLTRSAVISTLFFVAFVSWLAF